MLLHLGPGISAKASTSPAPGTGTTNKDKNDKQRNPAWTFGGISHAYIVATTLPHYKPGSLGYFFACAKDPGCPCATRKIDGGAAVWRAYRVWYCSPIPICCTVWPTEKSQAAHRYRLKSPTLPPCLKIATSDNWRRRAPATTRTAGCRQEPAHRPDGRRTAPACRALSDSRAVGSQRCAGTGPLPAAGGRCARATGHSARAAHQPPRSPAAARRRSAF
ncbi:hypothetical protein P3T40_008625 [Paraburkholderia sp. EB58]